MAKSSFSFGLFLCVSLLALVSFPVAIACGQDPGSEKEQDQIAREALETFTSADYVDERFGDILNEWRENIGVQILLHPSAMDNNLDLDKLITLNLGEVRFATLLSLALDPCDCTWHIRDGIVQIVSDDYAVENPIVESLNCSSILATIQPVKRQRIISANSPAGVPGGYGIRGGGVFSVVAQGLPESSQGGGDGIDPTGETSKDTVKSPPGSPFIVVEEVISPEDQLIQLIEELIDPDSWESNGGTGRIHSLNGMLFVVTTCENHRRVKVLLKELQHTPGESR
jgi:hypothetical protein